MKHRNLVVIICTVGIFLVGSIGLGLYIGFAESFEAEAWADTFLEDIGNGRIDKAYELTTKAFQSNQSLKEFRAFVKAYPGLRTPTARPWSRTMNSVSTAFSNKVNASVRLRHGNIDLACTLILVKENEQWKVDSFTIP